MTTNESNVKTPTIITSSPGPSENDATIEVLDGAQQEEDVLPEAQEGAAEGGAVDVDADDDDAIKYKIFTRDSYQKLLQREAEEKLKAIEKKNRPREGRLVDGELKFGDEEEEEEVKERDPRLVEGNTVPEYLQDEFPADLKGKPLEDIDPNIKDKTFVVIASRFKKKYIYRFSATNAFWFLPPWNPVRRAAVYIATNQFFDYFIITTILTNCVFLALTEPKAMLEIAEYVFLGIYTVEALIKLVARGFIFNSYTYLRDAWNWLDFIVIISAYTTMIVDAVSSNGLGASFAGLRTFRVLRALRTVSIVPGLKTIIQALLRCTRMLAEVMALTCFCLAVFALFALQVYMGMLRQKCVEDLPTMVNITHLEYAEHVRNSSHWFMNDDGSYKICGNSSGSGSCPANYTCLPDIGDNPRYGYTNFDHFGWSLLNNFQLLTLDFWEDPYNKVIRANGPWNIIYFIIVVFFGSFYLVNLMRAVVVMAYEEEAVNAGKEKELEKKELKKKRKKEEERRRASIMTESDQNGQVGGSETNNTDKTANGNHLKVVPMNGSSRTGSMSSLHSSENGGIHTSPSKLPPLDLTKAKGKSGGSDGTSDVKDSNPNAKGNKELVIPEIKTENESGEPSSSQKDDINPMATIDSQDSEEWTEKKEDEPTVVKIKDDEELLDRNYKCCGRCCACFICWLKFQNGLNTIVSDPIFELFITLCIFLNTVFLAIEYHGMSEELKNALNISNYVFTTIFTMEALLKLTATSRFYFKTGWNIFDLAIVVASLIDIAVQGIDGLSVFRAFRLLRVFKLAQSWSTMRVILSVILSTLGALGNLTFILGITMYIFAVIGMQLFRESYTTQVFYPNPVPRWNFSDFGHALMLIFRILCGEWIEPLWDCMKASGELCMVVFIPTLVFGNVMVLNLFLALLLNSFASDSLKRKKEETEESKVKLGWKKLKDMLTKRKNATVAPSSRSPSLASIAEELRKHQNQLFAASPEKEPGSKSVSETDGSSGLELQIMQANGSVTPSSDSGTAEKEQKANGSIKGMSSKNMEKTFNTDRNKFAQFNKAAADSKKTSTDNSKKSSTNSSKKNSVDSDKKSGEGSNRDSNASQEDKKPSKFATAFRRRSAKSTQDKDAESKKESEKNSEADDAEQEDKELQDCCPVVCYQRCCPSCLTMDETKWGARWRSLRTVVFKVTESRIFEYFILLLIFASSICLCFEDIYLDDNVILKAALYYLNIAFAVLFTIEMILKWISIGFKKYFSSFWTILDFCIVVISLVSIAAESLGADQISSFRVLRTLRALRPLRAISRWQGMKIVVNALMYAIPSIFHVLLVCLVFWLIFSIAGVQLFGGKFYKCVDTNGEPFLASIVPNKSVCLAGNHTWQNSKINFDHVFEGFLALFQVATFEGWMEVMRDAVDATSVDQQPRREANLTAYFFFVIFIIFGSFFTLNLFIGVIIDNFNMLKKKYEGDYLDMFLTPGQKNYYYTMKKLGNRKPQKTIKRPKNKVQGFFFDVSMSNKFELAIMILIILNMIAMMVEHYRQTQAFNDALDIINIIFTTIFTLECLVKMIGLRWHYFRRVWNVFDFIIVLFSIMGVILDDLLRNIFITPTLLRVIRVFRIGRVLRLIKAAKGIRQLLFALVISLPALFNIALLLFLLVSIFAIFGMTSFGNVKHTGALNDMVNFETFGNSMVLLFRLATSAGWNDILEPLLISPPDCDPEFRIMPDGTKKKVPNGDCGTAWLAITYMIFFIIINWLIIINMYMAIILENFNQAHQQEEVGITEDDFEMFYIVWEKYDPYATQFIKFDQLSDFVGELEEPLGIPKPNEIALVAFDLPIMEGDKLHCLDILVSLVKHVLGEVEETAEFKEIKSQIDEKFREQFPTRVQAEVRTSTMRRKKEDVAAKTLQRAWRKHKVQKNLRAITEMAMRKKEDQSSSISSSRKGSQASNIFPTLSSPQQHSSSQESVTVSPKSPTKRFSTMGNTLKVPSTSDIKLPSDSEGNV